MTAKEYVKAVYPFSRSVELVAFQLVPKKLYYIIYTDGTTMHQIGQAFSEHAAWVNAKKNIVKQGILPQS